MKAYLKSMLDPSHGAYRYLSGYLNGTGGLPLIDSIEIRAGGVGSVTIFNVDKGRMRIDSMHVPHGIGPALPFRVSIEETSIVFASDQNGGKNEFAEFARGGNVLSKFDGRVILANDLDCIGTELSSRITKWK